MRRVKKVLFGLALGALLLNTGFDAGRVYQNRLACAKVGQALEAMPEVTFARAHDCHRFSDRWVCDVEVRGSDGSELRMSIPVPRGVVD